MADLELPLVDVIVPIRNEERLLPDKVRNLGELDYPHLFLRFFLIDGSSTDGSAALAEVAAVHDPRIVVLRGPADKTLQLNLALAHCTAPGDNGRPGAPRE